MPFSPASDLWIAVFIRTGQQFNAKLLTKQGVVGRHKKSVKARNRNFRQVSFRKGLKLF